MSPHLEKNTFPTLETLSDSYNSASCHIESLKSGKVY